MSPNSQPPPVSVNPSMTKETAAPSPGKGLHAQPAPVSKPPPRTPASGQWAFVQKPYDPRGDNFAFETIAVQK
ncbi:hypothetical protein DRE_06492 [Drechslerella stenobrocha 248]|uniref:Uncharacterized protein n=1 Tax=Drechslerella stenobrocha 248 TaxID=1043628 RepID=W7HNI3_9PEZI|nr:hypothetical protein DRE_06492 [Drechslerella stenobrocha 248]